MMKKKMQAGGMPSQASRGLDRAAAMSGRAMPVRGDMADKMGRAMSVRGMKKGGKATGYKKGGAIDGVAHKGKTKGKMIKMASGGRC